MQIPSEYLANTMPSGLGEIMKGGCTVAESSQSGPDAETLRIAMDRLGAGQLDEAWLDRFAVELQDLVEMGRRLDQLDLSNEEPANVFVNKGGHN